MSNGHRENEASSRWRKRKLVGNLEEEEEEKEEEEKKTGSLIAHAKQRSSPVCRK
jgi:hypothetical protein